MSEGTKTYKSVDDMVDDICSDDVKQMYHEGIRLGRIVKAILSSVQSSLCIHFDEIEKDAAVAAGSDNSDKPVQAKVSISLSWEAGAEFPEIERKLSWSVRKVDEDTIVTDDRQGEFEALEGGEG